MKTFVYHPEKGVLQIDGAIVWLNTDTNELQPLEKDDPLLAEMDSFKDQMREALLEMYPGSTMVWFEDEIGTDRDPFKDDTLEEVERFFEEVERLKAQKWAKDYNNPHEKHEMN